MQLGRVLMFATCLALAACNRGHEQSERSAASPAPEDVKPLLGRGERSADGGNVLTNIRYIVVSTTLGASIGFVELDSDCAGWLDNATRRARHAELRMPAHDRFARNLSRGARHE